MLRLLIAGAAAAMVTAGSVADLRQGVTGTSPIGGASWNQTIAHAANATSYDDAAVHQMVEALPGLDSSMAVAAMETGELESSGGLSGRWDPLTGHWDGGLGASRQLLEIELVSLNSQTAVGFTEAGLAIPIERAPAHDALLASRTIIGGGSDGLMSTLAEQAPAILGALGICLVAIIWPLAAMKMRL